MMIEWEQNPPSEPMTWDESMDYANSLGDGWRLPTRGELVEAYDRRVEGFQSYYYWSSSTYVQNTFYAWNVFFSYGYVYYNRKTNSYYVRCVREVSV